MIVRAILTCGCVYRGERDGLRADVGGKVWCINCQTAAGVESIDPVALDQAPQR